MDFSTRFWMKVARTSPNECWEWQGGRSHGYGSVWGPDGKTHNAQRMAWTLAREEIPAGLHVLHTCDNPPCCNPAHLYLGTDAENAQDRVDRGRAVGNFDKAIAQRKPGWNRKVRADDRRGQNTPIKLTDAQVREIRGRKAPGVSNKMLGEEFGVSHVTIGDVLRRNGRYAGIE